MALVEKKFRGRVPHLNSLLALILWSWLFYISSIFAAKIALQSGDLEAAPTWLIMT